MGLFKGPKIQMSVWQMSTSWLDRYIQVWGDASEWKPPLPSILHISQAELGKGSGQLQGLLQATHVLACGLSRHIFATTFAIHQA